MLPESRKREMFASPMKYMAYPKIRLINSRKTAILTVCRRADLKIPRAHSRNLRTGRGRAPVGPALRNRFSTRSVSRPKTAAATNFTASNLRRTGKASGRESMMGRGLRRWWPGTLQPACLLKSACPHKNWRPPRKNRIAVPSPAPRRPVVREVPCGRVRR